MSKLFDFSGRESNETPYRIRGQSSGNSLQMENLSTTRLKRPCIQPFFESLMICFSTDIVFLKRL